jgi:hypothetical protein
MDTGGGLIDVQLSKNESPKAWLHGEKLQVKQIRKEKVKERDRHE